MILHGGGLRESLLVDARERDGWVRMLVVRRGDVEGSMRECARRTSCVFASNTEASICG